MDLQQAKEKLQKFGQEHVLKYYDELTEAEKQDLLKQIDETDFAILENCKNLGKRFLKLKKGTVSSLTQV